MKRPAIFFDRDNTLIANDGYLGDPDQVKLIPGAADAVARARTLGYAVVTVSNQSGVARGMFDEEAVRRVNERMDRLMILANKLSIIDRHEFCPFHPDAKLAQYRQESPLRKPSPGMIYKAASMMDLDIANSWVVGDAPRDIEAGRAAGCKTILFHDPTLSKSPAALEPAAGAPADFTVTTLKEAIDVIERESRRKQLQAVAAATAAQQPSGKPSRIPPAVAEPEESISPARLNGEKRDDANGLARIESLLTQLIQDTRRRNEVAHHDFSVPKLLAGIVQVIVLALLFMAYLGHPNVQSLLTLTVVLQIMVASLLLMGKRS